MRIFGLSASAVALATAAVPLALFTQGSAGTAAAAPQVRDAQQAAPVPMASEVDMEFVVHNLPPGKFLLLSYDTGGVVSKGGTATGSGIGSVTFSPGSIELSGFGGEPLFADLTAFLSISVPTFSGTAVIPAGTSVSLTNKKTHTTIGLSNGDFSIATGVGGGLGISPGTNVIFEPELAEGLAITGPASDGQPVELTSKTGLADQVWTLVNPDGVTQIINKKTGLCLDVASVTAGATVIAAICNASPSQQWVEGQQQDGAYRLLNYASHTSGVALVATVSIGTSDVVIEPIAGGEFDDWAEAAP
jgi:hypothetical protein